jgi:histidinol-phosphate/aromatic aminotransferase/cobyric acid decarboxylase-like protein
LPTRGVPPPGAHGDDATAVARALGIDAGALIDLSSSTNPFAPDVACVAAAHLRTLRSYPDARDATVALASALGVDADRVVLTNGASEAIALVAAELVVGRVDDPEFSLYRRHLARTEADAPRWRSNPNNPLGTLAAPTDRAAVWDESFWPLATGTWTRGDDDAWRIGSLTKLWACPGLRLGFVIAPDPLGAARVAARQPRWSVNALGVAVVPELLARTTLARWSEDIAQLRATFAAQLCALGYQATPSAANWVLVHELVDGRARLAPHGVLVRDTTSFGLTDTVRVALPAPNDLPRVVAAFACLR